MFKKDKQSTIHLLNEQMNKVSHHMWDCKEINPLIVDFFVSVVMTYVPKDQYNEHLYWDSISNIGSAVISLANNLDNYLVSEESMESLKEIFHELDMLRIKVLEQYTGLKAGGVLNLANMAKLNELNLETDTISKLIRYNVCNAYHNEYRCVRREGMLFQDIAHLLAVVRKITAEWMSLYDGGFNFRIISHFIGALNYDRYHGKTYDEKYVFDCLVGILDGTKKLAPALHPYRFVVIDA